MRLVTQNLAPKEVDLFCPRFLRRQFGVQHTLLLPPSNIWWLPSICPPSPSWMNEDRPIFRETTFPSYVGQGCWDCVISQWSSAHSSRGWVPTTTILGFFFFHLFIWPCQVLVVAHRIFDLFAGCGIWILDRGWNLGPLHWERRILVTRLPGKSPIPGILNKFLLNWKEKKGT